MDWLLILSSLLLPVVPLFFFPGCVCCTPPDPCALFSDDFAVDNLATDWDDRSGTWAVSAGLLTSTSTDALIVSTTAVPADATAVYSEVSMSFTATTATGRLVIAYIDDDNYWFAELQAGASDGTLKLYERSGGTNTQRGSTATVTGLQVNETMEVSLCYADGEFIASASGIFIEYTSTVTIGETQCGVGTGGGAGTRSFDDFAFTRHYTDVEECARCVKPCGPSGGLFACQDAPFSATITLGGFSNGSCSSCTSLNATFIVSGEWSSVAGICIMPNHVTGFCSKVVTVQKLVASTMLRVRLSGTGPTWEKTGMANNCTEYTNESVPWTSDSDGAVCIHNATTAAIVTLS